MTAATGVIALLRRGIADPATQWSLGSFGAIAEFSRDDDEPAQLTMTSDTISVATERGGSRAPARARHPAIRVGRHHESGLE